MGKPTGTVARNVACRLDRATLWTICPDEGTDMTRCKLRPTMARIVDYTRPHLRQTRTEADGGGSRTEGDEVGDDVVAEIDRCPTTERPRRDCRSRWCISLPGGTNEAEGGGFAPTWTTAKKNRAPTDPACAWTAAAAADFVSPGFRGRGAEGGGGRGPGGHRGRRLGSKGPADGDAVAAAVL